MAGQAELGEQCLGGRDPVRFLGDVAVRQRPRGVGGEHAEQLRGGAVAELVEAAAQRLAVDRQAGPARLGRGRLQQAGMAAEGGLQRAAAEALQDVADRGVCRRASPVQPERPVQPAAVRADEGGDAAIRVAAADDGQDGEQQHLRQSVELALRTASVGHLLQQAQKRCKRGAAVQTRSRQPPPRLPTQESEFRRAGNPASRPPPPFFPDLLRRGLTRAPHSVEQPWPPDRQSPAPPEYGGCRSPRLGWAGPPRGRAADTGGSCARAPVWTCWAGATAPRCSSAASASPPPTGRS